MSLENATVQKSIKKLRNFLKQAPKNPSQDTVHSLRTSARRFEAAWEAVGVESRKDRRVLKELGRLRKRAGKIRDLDVFSSNVFSIHVRGEESCSVALLQYLGAERYRQTRKLHGQTIEAGKKLRRRLRRAASRLEHLIPADPYKTSEKQEAAAADAMETALKLAGELEDPAVLNKSNLHEYRRRVTELRDVLQLARDQGHREFVDELGQVKDQIGEWHDWQELASVATEVLQHPNCQLLKKLKAIAEQKYEKGLNLAHSMRKAYLQPREENKKQPTPIDRRPTLPVLKATSSIAS